MKLDIEDFKTTMIPKIHNSSIEITVVVNINIEKVKADIAKIFGTFYLHEKSTTNKKQLADI